MWRKTLNRNGSVWSGEFEEEIVDIVEVMEVAYAMKSSRIVRDSVLSSTIPLYTYYGMKLRRSKTHLTCQWSKFLSSNNWSVLMPQFRLPTYRPGIGMRLTFRAHPPRDLLAAAPLFV